MHNVATSGECGATDGKAATVFPLVQYSGRGFQCFVLQSCWFMDPAFPKSLE